MKSETFHLNYRPCSKSSYLILSRECDASVVGHTLRIAQPIKLITESRGCSHLRHVINPHELFRMHCRGSARWCSPCSVETPDLP